MLSWTAHVVALTQDSQMRFGRLGGRQSRRRSGPQRLASLRRLLENRLETEDFD